MKKLLIIGFYQEKFVKDIKGAEGIDKEIYEKAKTFAESDNRVLVFCKEERGEVGENRLYGQVNQWLGGEKGYNVKYTSFFEEGLQAMGIFDLVEIYQKEGVGEIEFVGLNLASDLCNLIVFFRHYFKGKIMINSKLCMSDRENLDNLYFEFLKVQNISIK